MIARDALQKVASPSRTVRGRDAELAMLGVELGRVQAGIGAVVLVEGGPGMGKSRLLGEAARVAGRMSFQVGIGAAEPAGSVVELAPLLAALFEGVEPMLDRDAPTLRASCPSSATGLQDLQALLERAALQQPLLVCLDDMQWADAGTAAALRALPARLAALPIAWLIAFRPDHLSLQVSSAFELLEREGAERIVLGPLDEAAVAGRSSSQRAGIGTACPRSPSGRRVVGSRSVAGRGRDAARRERRSR